MSIVYVVTHTEATHHIENKVGGWYDSHLTDHGEHQARQLAEALSQSLDGPAASVPMFTSDLRRTHRTAEIIAARLGAPMTVDPRLREMSNGIAGGRPREWLSQHAQPLPEDGNKLDYLSCEGAETRRDVCGRIYPFVEELARDLPPESIVVTHGFVLTFVIAAWIGMPVESVGRVFFPAVSGSITVLEQSDEWLDRRVMKLADSGHLD